MMTRYSFVRQGLATSTNMLLAGVTGFSFNQLARTIENRRWQVPDGGAPYAATWMALGASTEIWGPHLLPMVQKNLALVAGTIAALEPVSMLVREEDSELAAHLYEPSVNLLVHPIDGLWICDTGPVFVKDASSALGGVGFNFNDWDNKQEYERDANVAGFATGYVQAEFIRSALTLEGGDIEVDGEGMAIITENYTLNPNRNSGVGEAKCKEKLKRLSGLGETIQLSGIAGKGITDGHTDFYARFTHPGTMVAGLGQDPSSFNYTVTRRHLDILRAATDAKGRRLKVVTLERSSTIRRTYANDDFTVGYINFYLCNDTVIAPQFGDKRTDRNAHAILQELFADREVIRLSIDNITAGGGSIHCVTQRQPR